MTRYAVTPTVTPVSAITLQEARDQLTSALAALKRARDGGHAITSPSGGRSVQAQMPQQHQEDVKYWTAMVEKLERQQNGGGGLTITQVVPE